MNLGDRDGHGHYGVLDEDSDGLLCHECGRRFTHLGLHAWKGHGITAADYRQEHGLARSRGLVATSTRNALTHNARRSFATKKAFLTNRDPAAATAARLSNNVGMSPAGLAASRSRPGQGRLGTVVVCGWCQSQFCPLSGARRRRFCSKSCASKATRATAWRQLKK
ncbi:MucR family transcriptional regulator [Flexivirga sp. B27]